MAENENKLKSFTQREWKNMKKINVSMEGAVLRRCPVCGVEKPLNEFYLRPNKCKLCSKKNITGNIALNTGKRKTHENVNIVPWSQKKKRNKKGNIGASIGKIIGKKYEIRDVYMSLKTERK